MDNTYWPLALRRQPFLIGQQLIKEDGVERAHRVLHIDTLDHPRVSKLRVGISRCRVVVLVSYRILWRACWKLCITACRTLSS
ncbi:MAG: hypothetical protein U5L01_07770 [Rheinheimera sp.]|nr:hypothetical protein [Rheinheimera sp.]